MWARWPILAFWIAAAVAATIYLPDLGSGKGSSPEGLVNMNAEAIQAQVRGYEAFGFPLLTEIEVVEHDAQGLSAAAQTRAVQQAVDFEQLQIPGLAGALPVPNTIREVPGTKAPSTTVVTYLYFEPGTKLSEQYRGAHQYAATLAQDPEAGRVGVTGAVAARVEAESEIDKALPYVEIGTVLIVALVLAIALRSLLAPHPDAVRRRHRLRRRAARGAGRRRPDRRPGAPRAAAARAGAAARHRHGLLRLLPDRDAAAADRPARSRARRRTAPACGSCRSSSRPG